VNGWMNDWLEVDANLGPMLSRYGFVSDGATDDTEYGDLPAWSVSTDARIASFKCAGRRANEEWTFCSRPSTRRMSWGL
jgi:hypothetical protein